MSHYKASVAFDVLGTCFTLDVVNQAMEDQFGDLLKVDGVIAKTLVYDWFHSAQRDYTYLSLSSSHTPIAQILASTLPRALAMNLPSISPSQYESSFSKEKLESVTAALKKLTPVEGLKEALEILKKGGVQVWAVSNGAKTSSAGYFALADLTSYLDGGILSCDDIPPSSSQATSSSFLAPNGVAKPHPRVYQFSKSVMQSSLDASKADLQSVLENGGGVLEQEESGLQGSKAAGEGKLWFVAAHAWDLAGAKKGGFLTGYSTHEEKIHPLEPSIFASMGPDVKGSTLVEVAKQIVKQL